jgi:hypothetical protein
MKLNKNQIGLIDSKFMGYLNAKEIFKQDWIKAKTVYQLKYVTVFDMRLYNLITDIELSSLTQFRDIK